MAVGAANAQPTRLADYAVFGLEDVTLGRGVRVEGGVGANRGTLRLGAGARVEAAVAADTIRIGSRARAESLFCRLLVGRVRVSCESLSLPLVDTRALRIVQVVPGGAEVRVPARASAAPLVAGAYGEVRVGRRGRLLLAGGRYELQSIALARRSRLQCAAPCEVAVLERVMVGKEARLGAAAPLDARAVRIDVEADGERNGFVARPRASIAANVYAPESTIVLGAGGRHDGAFVGRSVRIGAAAEVTAASAF
jgi:hypothetical protein